MDQTRNERWMKLEEDVESVTPAVVKAARLGMRMIVVPEEVLAKDLTDRGLQVIGALVKVCGRYGTIITFADSSSYRFAVPRDAKTSDMVVGEIAGDPHPQA